LAIPFRLEDDAEPIARMMVKYSSVPMSLADACLVRMAEKIAGSEVLTIDGDFRIYRKHGRQAIRTILPGGA
jgi:predicted nucleic acid-binding protein